ncbi:MAG: NlpC/P60 family protein [Chloroflexota bacterium]|nr:NlpC/P60 family protein [Chloroflexota bacterium]
MSVHRRSLRSLLIIVLAVPAIVAVYLTSLGRTIVSLPRTSLAALLGATVIGSVYADEAIRRGPEGIRRGLDALPATRVSPLKTATVAALAIALLGAGAPAAPVSAAKASEAVIQAARGYLGTPYRLGGEGPKTFDCSGLIFRIFADTGQLSRIGGARMRAARYLKWFSARGLTSKKDGQRGDLVIYANGKHMGIYLGRGKVISAVSTGVSVHRLHGLTIKFTTFLKVNWSGGKGGGAGAGSGGAKDRSKGKQDGGRKDKDRQRDNGGAGEAGGGDVVATDAAPVVEQDESSKGFATGTMNLRRGHGPDEKIIGWVSRGSRFTITGTGQSPSGALWYSVVTKNGKDGWVYSRWVRVLDD